MKLVIDALRRIPVLCLTIALSAPAEPPPIIDYESRFHPVIGKRGIVSSQELRASEIGLHVLKDGGNAVDSAVAMAFALAVTLPKAGNLGGGGFMLVHSAEDGKTYALDFREMAPAAAERDLYLDKAGEVDKERARFSPQSVAVPGTVQGLEVALEKFGSKSLSDLIQPAILLARDGIAVSPGLAADLIKYEEKLKSSPAIAEIFYRNDGTPYGIGDRLFQRDLAWSMEQIASEGSNAFYEGEIADKLVAFMQAEGGLITAADLENYRVKEREAIRGTYRGYEIVSMPPPSSGGVHLIQMLNTLENTSLKKMGHNSARSIHHLAETMKYAYADRSAHLGDPDYVKVPVTWLTSKKYGKELFSRIRADEVVLSAEIKPGSPVEYESEETTHFSVMDERGNAVSLTYTLNFSFGSLQMAPGTGILLNNEMNDFSAKPGVANAFGLLGGEANSIQPGKRPLSSMTPTLVLKDGEPYLVTGSPGGAKIITSVLQTVLNVIEYDMNIAEASSVPRIHHQWMPDELRCESGISVDTLEKLESYGHKPRGTTTLGSTQSVMKVGNRFEGFSDPRRPDAATIAW
ncbi:MAG: gamma-glutamyltransferase [Verrucomicrobiales bacterium]|nr:gamma-glutamyltransferase [Verrucomicrobiales bacterium]